MSSLNSGGGAGASADTIQLAIILSGTRGGAGVSMFVGTGCVSFRDFLKESEEFPGQEKISAIGLRTCLPVSLFDHCF